MRVTGRGKAHVTSYMNCKNPESIGGHPPLSQRALLQRAPLSPTTPTPRRFGRAAPSTDIAAAAAAAR